LNADVETKLIAWFSANECTRFEWGRFDCSLAAADWVEYVTGRHPCPELVGIYSDSDGAKELIDGAGGHIELVSRYLGEPTGELSYQTSDVVMIEQNGKQILAVGYYGQVIAAGPRGVIALCKSRFTVKAVWRIL